MTDSASAARRARHQAILAEIADEETEAEENAAITREELQRN